jgi:hypothetical protein
MGLSRKRLKPLMALETSMVKIGLINRLWNLGFETKLFLNAYVYHKRRIDWDKFSVQVNKFGRKKKYLTVGILNTIHVLFPSVFIIGFA